MITNSLANNEDQEKYNLIKAFDITIKLIKNHLQVHREHMNSRIVLFLTSELQHLENQRSIELKKINGL